MRVTGPLSWLRGVPHGPPTTAPMKKPPATRRVTGGYDCRERGGRRLVYGTKVKTPRRSSEVESVEVTAPDWGSVVCALTRTW